MTVSHRQEIVDFSNHLGMLRQQVSDQGLLDRCKVYLAELLELSKDCGLEADPQPLTEQAA